MCALEGLLTPESARAMVRIISLKTGAPLFDDDLVQEALLRGIRALGRSSRIDHPHAFFAKIVRDTLYDHWRNRHVLLSLDVSDGYEPMISVGLDENIDRQRQLDQIYEALDRLSLNQRELFDLYYFEELSIAEIVSLLGKSRSAIKMGLLRGRNRIIDLLADKPPHN
jgi:RNA polymerase sigma factor (sigma-70 family)